VKGLAIATSLLMGLGVLGCALTGKNEAMVPRFFTLEAPAHPTAAPVRRADAAAMPELRLGRVTAAADIGEAIVYRQSDRELGFYDDRLWSEKPSAVLERELARVLFEEKGLRRVLEGTGPVLDVSLDALEEVRGKTPKARVEIKAVLYEDRAVRFEHTFVVEQPIIERRRGDVESVAALADALATAVAQISDRVIVELLRPPSAAVSNAASER